MKETDLDFYFQHRSEIYQSVELHKSFKDFIFDELKKVSHYFSTNNSEEISNFKDRFEDRISYLQYKNKNLGIVLKVEDLFRGGNKLDIFVELRNDLMQMSYQDIQLVTNEGVEKIAVNDRIKEFEGRKLPHAHIYTKAYHLKDSEIKQLSDFIIDKLKSDHLLAVFNQLKTQISQS